MKSLPPWLRGRLPAGGVFLLLLAYYGACLAPGVTFEDSGELITAAYRLGVPHEPGYPLFTLLGRLWIALCPFGGVAFRMNLLSAIFSAAGAALLCLVIEELLLPGPLTRGIAAAAALLVGASPAYLGQAVITEVYGLNDLFAGLLLLLLIRWYRCPAERPRRLRAFGLVAGLACANHQTSAAFLPFAFLFGLLTEGRRFLKPRLLLEGALLFLAGLLPYAWLLLAARGGPALNWGDPRDLTGLWRVVTRHQYGLVPSRDLSLIARQLGWCASLPFREFPAAPAALGIAGLAALFLRERKLAAWLALGLFFTGPLVAYLTAPNLGLADPAQLAEERALLAVFYLPFYMIWGIAIAAGALELGRRALARWPGTWIPLLFAGLGIAVCAAQAGRSRSTEEMSHYIFPAQLADNLEAVTEARSLVISNWDPFVFPMIYYQQVEGRFRERIFVDVELLRRSWYVRQLARWYPDFMAGAAREMGEFLDSVRAFEDGGPFDSALIQARYLALINALIDRAYAVMPVYLTIHAPLRPLERGVATRYRREPLGAAYRLRENPETPTPLAPEAVRVTGLADPAIPKDRMARMLREYYFDALDARGRYLEAKAPEEARRFHEKARELAPVPGP